MSDKSPLFVSSLELIAHATELFAGKNPKKYKFIILHLANAVELVLKDCVIDQGVSIYVDNKPGTTINLWESIKRLKEKGIVIPELPVIELLVDDRNTIQHRFGHPSAESTYYYIEQVIQFFQRFLHHHYNIHLVEALKTHLSDEHLELLGLIKDEFSYLDQLASISIELSVLRAATIVRHELGKYWHNFTSTEDLIKKNRRFPLWQRRFFDELLKDLKRKGYVQRDMVKGYAYLQEARNYAAHNPEETNDIDWREAFNIAKELLTGLQEAASKEYNFELDDSVLNQWRKSIEADGIRLSDRTNSMETIDEFLRAPVPSPNLFPGPNLYPGSAELPSEQELQSNGSN